jgi:hypothetical protein
MVTILANQIVAMGFTYVRRLFLGYLGEKVKQNYIYFPTFRGSIRVGREKTQYFFLLHVMTGLFPLIITL